jgi:hypothetical protein
LLPEVLLELLGVMEACFVASGSSSFFTLR